MPRLAFVKAWWTRRGLTLWSRLWLWPRVGIGTKMTVIVIVGTVALVSLFAYIGTTALNENLERSLQERVAIASSTARHIDHVMGDIDRQLAQAAEQEGLMDPAHAAEVLEKTHLRVGDLGRQLYLLDGEGRLIAAYPAVPPEKPLPDLAVLRMLLAGESFAISHSAGRPILAATPVRDSSGNLVGAVILEVDLAAPGLLTFLEPIGLGRTGYMDLVASDGTILASTRAQRIGQSSDHNTVLADRIRTRQTLVSRCHGCHTADESSKPLTEVLAFAPMSGAPWGVTVLQEEEEVLAAARGLEVRIFAVGAMALAGALFLVYLTTQSVITPVQVLQAATQRIAAGDLDTPIGDYGKDEIGALAGSFDVMRSRLQHSMAEIQRWNRELDARVHARTADLAAAQQEAQHSRDQLQTIIDSLSDELLVIDRDYRVTRVNAAARRRHADNLNIIGSYCYQVTHAGLRCQTLDCECPVPRVIETGKPLRVTHLHVNGASPRFVEVIASPLLNAEQEVTGIVELQRDVTEEKNLEETILQRNRELSSVNAIARVMGQSLRIDESLQLALSEVRRITRMDMGAIFLTQGEDRRLCLHNCYGISAQEAQATGRLALSDVACGGVLQIGEPVIVQNTGRSQRLNPLTSREPLASLIHVPFTSKGTPLGTLCLGTRTPREFTTEEISLLSAIGSQIAIAVENAQLYEELSRKEQLRGELLRRVISAQEDERKRIARELHDETTQTLSALLYTLDAATGTRKPSQVQAYLAKVRELTVNAIDGVHKIIFDLRPTMLDQLGLVAALRWYADKRLGEAGVRVEVAESGAIQRLPSPLETALFRTVQEALNNIARHAGARHVRIGFDFQPDRIQVKVEDDGIGFQVRQVAASSDPRCGLGLVSMEERMIAVGGDFYLTSVPGEGTVILLRAPITGRLDGSDSNTGRG